VAKATIPTNTIICEEGGHDFRCHVARCGYCLSNKPLAFSTVLNLTTYTPVKKEAMISGAM
jgi:predicted amidophosphoribosyltransferase